MGNTTQNQSSNHVDIASLFQEIRIQQFGKIVLHKQTKMTYLLKQLSFSDGEIYKRQLSRYETQAKEGLRENLLSIVKVQGKTINNFCSTTHKIYIIYEYPQVTLKEEILARQKEGKNFEQTQLWSILQSCVNALTQLKPTLCLNTSMIFISSDGELKIINNDMIDDSYRLIVNDTIYYAPEKIKNFMKNDQQQSLRKERVFSMGMTILHAAQLFDAYECYDYNQNIFFESNLQSMIQNIAGNYTQDFIEILANILQPNPNRRASLSEVQNMLQNYWNSQSQKQHNQPLPANGSSLNIQSGIQNEKKIALKEQLQNRIFKNLTTVNSNQKDSMKFQGIGQSKNNNIIAKEIKQSQQYIPQPPAAFESGTKKVDKENLYTDPKLLEMIRRDLCEISKLKQSAIYQTSKYSYLFPQTQSVLSSIKQTIKDISPPTHKEKEKSTQTSFVKKQQKQICLVKCFDELNINERKSISKSKKTIEIDIKNTKTNMPTYAVQTYQDGRRFEGMIFNGLKNGKGKLIFDDGAYYEGQFKNDKMNGKGILYYSLGKPAYDGEWYQDQFHGYGILYNENPQILSQPANFKDLNDIQDYWVRYQGYFNEDNKCGKGRLVLSNGEIMEGQFTDDCINGKGRFHPLEGKPIDGVWQMNMFVSPL